MRFRFTEAREKLRETEEWITSDLIEESIRELGHLLDMIYWTISK